MRFSCALSSGSPATRPVRRGLVLLLALGTLVTGGYAASTPTVRGSQAVALATRPPADSSQPGASRPAPGSNPRKIVCKSREEALKLGNSYARDAGAKLLITSGTRSMEPLIRGRSYVVVQSRPYDSITKGDLLVYMGRPSAAKPARTSMLHRAVMQDKAGWLMSGDNNRYSESWDRVTPVTYVGTVTTILEFPQT